MVSLGANKSEKWLDRLERLESLVSDDRDGSVLLKGNVKVEGWLIVAPPESKNSVGTVKIDNYSGGRI
ncbi:MAG: hypothetical protein AAFQ16_12620, partial [Pseudomonadota bacterium]